MDDFDPFDGRIPARHRDRGPRDEIREKTLDELACVQAGSERDIDAMLDMVDEEWDVGRVLEAGASAMILAGTALGYLHSKKWFLLSGALGSLMLWHALSGWRKPVPLLHNIGLRTADEIGNERIVLKMMRKDFQNIPQNVRAMMEAAEM